MKIINRGIVILFLFSAITAYSQSQVKALVSFFETQNKHPKEYIFDLFKTNDIVIIGERDHRDTTQYDLILDIVKDKRFIENIGHIYTEVGVINQTNWANEILKGNYTNKEDFDKDFKDLYRNLDFNALWDKYNMVKYLKGIYSINKDLEANDKITVGFTDCALDWKTTTTHEQYKQFIKQSLKGYGTRDSIMAFNFLKLYDAQKLKNGKKKALLIQSRPHAINLNVDYKNIRIKKTGAYIKEVHSDKVKIVAFNWYKWVPSEWNGLWHGPKHEIALTDNGKWDAAYEMTGKPTIAFDIKNTPFGNTIFDYSYEQSILFEDVIDGMIFYLPFYEFTCTRGLPNIVDVNFAKTFIKRIDIINGNTDYSKKYSPQDEVLDWGDFRETDCVDFDELKVQMQQWIKD